MRDELPLSLNAHFPKPELLLLFDLSAQTAANRYASRTQKDITNVLIFRKSSNPVP